MAAINSQVADEPTCRTCFEHGDVYFLLESPANCVEAPDKSFLRLLQHVTKIEDVAECADKLPKYLCGKCAERLKDAYVFIMQAQNVNNKLLRRLQMREDVKADCLLETPIDMPSSGMEVKIEIEIDNGTSNCNNISYNTILTSDAVLGKEDPIIVHERKATPTHQESESMTVEYLEETIEEPPCDDDESIALTELSRQKSRRGKEAVSMESNLKYSCTECGKAFAWHSDLLRHEQTHFDQARYVCSICSKKFLRKDKLSDHLKTHVRRSTRTARQSYNDKYNKREDERLYTNKPIETRQCALCSADGFRSSIELQEHVLSHVDPDTYQLQRLSPIVKELFEATRSLDDIKKCITEDITRKSLAKFCIITNCFGYEMSLSDDSDTDSVLLSNSDVVGPSIVPKYNCQLCGAAFAGKRGAQQHRDEHEDELLPFECEVCNLKFVSIEIYESHQRHHCCNPLRHHQCGKCLLKFQWKKNLEAHICVPETPTNESGTETDTECRMNFRDVRDGDGITESIEVDSLTTADAAMAHNKCCLCSCECGSLEELYGHLMTHSDGSRDIDYDNGLYFKVHYPKAKSCQEKVGAKIAEMFRNNMLSQFYSAVDDEGNELNFSMLGAAIDTGQRADEKNLGEMKRSIRFKCDKCLSFFVWKFNLENHKRWKHAESTVVYEEKSVKQFQCDQCYKRFATQRDLSRHKPKHEVNRLMFSCLYCEKKFSRKDNMKVHMKKHTKEKLRTGKQAKTVEEGVSSRKARGVDPNLCRPHGCKVIQCMICLSKHSRIADLRRHLTVHQTSVSFEQRSDSIVAIAQRLYPDEKAVLSAEMLAERISSDLRDQRYERFYSITNEVGYEISLSSSETDSDVEDEMTEYLASGTKGIGNGNSGERRHGYACGLCGLSFERKYQLFQHQMYVHSWKEAPYVCAVCNARFLSKEILLHHYRRQCKNALKRYVCRKCQQCFMWPVNLKNHMVMMHSLTPTDERMKSALPEPRSFVCLECNSSFVMQKDLASHMLMHRNDSLIFQCQWCARKFYHKNNLLMHIRRHGIVPEALGAEECIAATTRRPHGRKKIICKICNTNFDKIHELRQHLGDGNCFKFDPMTDLALPSADSMQAPSNYSIVNEMGIELDLDDSETDEEDCRTLYTCELCKLVCKRKFEVAQHQRSMHRHEDLPLTCDRCVFRTVSKDVLAQHMRSLCHNKQKQFQCELCPYKFMWAENLESHMQQLHPNKETESNRENNAAAENAERCYECPDCGKRYSRQVWLVAHRAKRHPTAAVDGKGGNAVATSDHLNAAPASLVMTTSNRQVHEKKFLCTFCGRGVTSSSSLIVHMRRHTGEKPFKCDFCDMSFPRSSDLVSHRRKHTGERPNKCTVCGKAFARAYKLKTHMRIHSGEKPYKCTFCEKSFAQSNDLTLHVRRHTGERPYVCAVCGERFIQNTALKNHRIMRGHFEELEAAKNDTELTIGSS